MASLTIGAAATAVGSSVDTLRYYEKIGLLGPIERTGSGVRRYNERDISRLKFIKRAQQMNFSLAEIGDLLKMRENPQQARDEVRQLTVSKLQEVELRMQELETLRRELTLLVNLCRASEAGCPIIDGMDESDGPP